MIQNVVKEKENLISKKLIRFLRRELICWMLINTELGSENPKEFSQRMKKDEKIVLNFY
jgi:hypothetical protein